MASSSCTIPGFGSIGLRRVGIVREEEKINWSYGCAEVNSNADAALSSPHFPGFHVQRAIGLACLAWRVGDYFWAPIR